MTTRRLFTKRNIYSLKLWTSSSNILRLRQSVNMLLMLMVITSSLVVFIPTVGATGEQITMKMPFGGNWAYNTPTTASCGTDSSQTAHPSCHGTSGTDLLGYDWATDYYAANGTSVKVNGSSAQGTVSFSSSTSSGSCGDSLVITATVNSVTVGQMYVTHLDNSVVSSNLSNESQIGTVHYQCFGVNHVHFSYKNNVSNHACYINYSNSTYTAGMYVNYGSSIGVLGSSNTGVQQVCSSSTPSGTTASTSRPAVLTRSSTSEDVFYRSTSHELIEQGWNATNGWGGLKTAASSGVSSNPTAVTRTSDSMDAFYRDTSNNLEVVGWSATGDWTGPTAIITDGSVNGDPVVIAPDSNHMWVFYKDSSSRLMDKQWNSTTGWASPHIDISSASVASSPSAIVLDANNFFVFYRNSSGNMDEIGYSSGAWSGPSTRANNVASDFSAISRTSTSLDLFYKASGGGLGNVGYSSGSWSDYEWTVGNTIATSGNSFSGSPQVIKRDSNNMSVFYQDNHNNLVEKAWNGTTGWAAPYNRASNIYDNPGGASRTSDSLDVLFRDGTTNLITQGWNATTGWGQGPTGAGNVD